MLIITTNDGTQLHYKEWTSEQPAALNNGCPQSAQGVKAAAGPAIDVECTVLGIFALVALIAEEHRMSAKATGRTRE